jgi:hypothetical protein
MAYKKYIKRNGKVYGPYVYHSRRVNGKVVSEYRGTKEENNYKKYVFPVLGFFILIAFIFGLSMLDRDFVSGRVVLDLGASYIEGQPLNGNLRFLLTEGELIPSNSSVIFETSTQRYEYPLNEVVPETPVEGDYYISGKFLSGSGQGYGIEGQGDLNPIVYFTLKIIASSDNSSSEEVIVNDPINEIIQDVNETNTTGLGEVVSNFFLALTPTGNVVLEADNLIEAEVSANNNYILELGEGQTAELISGSVKTDLEDLSDEILLLEKDGNNLIITTTYIQSNSGFGKDYLGNEEKVLEMQLNDLGMIFEPGELSVKVIYEEQEIVSLTTTLQGGDVSGNQEITQTPVDDLITEPEPIIAPEPNTEPSTALKGLPAGLTDVEKNILLSRFGSQELEITKAKAQEKRVIIRYELGDYWYEATYDSSLSKEELVIQMDNDKEKWLRDIASSLSVYSSNDEGEDLEEFLGNYSL